MRYSSIRKMDISNGDDLGVSLFVQGCKFHCEGCFNSETWDFNGGKPWTQETKEKFLELMKPHYIKRVTILGGEPLVDENVFDVLDVIKSIREKYPDMKIWVYSGYRLTDIIFNADHNHEYDIIRKQVIQNIDIMVDGQFKLPLRDLTLKFKGSSNQRVIDVKKTLLNLYDGNTILIKMI